MEVSYDLWLEDDWMLADDNEVKSIFQRNAMIKDKMESQRQEWIFKEEWMSTGYNRSGKKIK